MTVVLPDEGGGESRPLVAGGGLADDPRRGRAGRGRPELPRWTFRTEAPLSDTLTALGMPTAFDEAKADFSG